MSSSGLILTYHAIERGPAPLCIDPSLFRTHLDCIVEAGLETLTIGRLADGLRRGDLPERWAAITFDDGFASVTREAAPALLERGLVGTVFCVSGYVGDLNAWPTQPEKAPRLALATPAALAALAQNGFEIGSHGLEHAPLDTASDDVARRELLDSKHILEQAVGVTVRSFAYPYGALPTSKTGRSLVEGAYSAACTTTIGVVDPGADPLALPRVDAHYLRRLSLLGAAIQGDAGSYLLVRRLGARARRLLRPDYARSGG